MLQGSLENFALDEVLGLLSGTSKTGRLEVSGNRGSGSLSFSEGRLTNGSASATVNGTEIEDVMFELLRFGEGTFSFSNQEVGPADDAQDVAAVLATAEHRLHDWRAIEAVVPTLSHHVSPTVELPSDEVTITRDEWAVLTVIAAGCPAAEVCDRLKLGEVEGSRRIKNLAERSLVTIGEPAGNFASVARASGGSNRPDNELVGAGLTGSTQSSSGDLLGNGLGTSIENGENGSLGGSGSLGGNGTGNGTGHGFTAAPAAEVAPDPGFGSGLDSGYQVLGSDDATSVDDLAGSNDLLGSNDVLGSNDLLGSNDSAGSNDLLGSSDATGWNNDDSLFAAPDLGQSEITPPGDFGSGPALGSLLGDPTDERPPMPPAPNPEDLLSDHSLAGDVPAGLVPPIGSIDDETSELDESTLSEGSKEDEPAQKGGLLSRYLSSDD